MRFLAAAIFAVVLACSWVASSPAASPNSDPRAVVRAHLTALRHAHDDGIRYWTLVDIANRLGFASDPKAGAALNVVKATLIADYRRACKLVALTVPLNQCVTVWYSGRVGISKFTVGRASSSNGEATVQAVLDGTAGSFLLAPSAAGWKITSWRPSVGAPAPSRGPAA